MNDKKYDVAVIGGGPAGYPAAIRAAQLGLSAVCIDDWKNADGTRLFGGTCLNVGCIPSKALLESTELYHRAHSEFAAHGIKIDTLTLDLETMQNRKRGIVKQFTSGYRGDVQSRGRRRHQRARPTVARQSRRSHDGRRRSAGRCRPCRARDGLGADRAADRELRRHAHRRLDRRIGVHERAEASRRHRRGRDRARARQRVAQIGRRSRDPRSAR